MLSIIIVTYNSSYCLRSCMQSVYQNKLSENFNIVIIDNASKDKESPKQIISSLGLDNMTFLENQENVGFAKAVNQGLKYAREKYNSDFYLLLNPDATLKENCLEKLLEYSAANDNIGLLSPLILSPQNNSVWFSHGYIDWLRMKTIHADDEKIPFYGTPYLTGCCLLIKKEVLDNIGFLDEQYFLYYEDADYSVRAQKAGFKIATHKDAVCYHSASQSSDESTKTYYLVKSGLLFFHKHIPAYMQPYFWTTYRTRRIYHRLITHKPAVLLAIKDFTNSNS